MSSPHSNTQTAPVNEDDGGLICPICESGCTCHKKKPSITPKRPKLNLLKKKVPGPRPKTKRLVRRRPQVEDHDDSDEEEKFLLEDDEDVEPSAPLDLPTFISASSSSSDSSSLSSLSSSEDSDLDIEDIEDEKQRRIRKARVQRELLGENAPRQNAHSHHTSNRWDIKPRKRSASETDGEADVDMSSESGDTTESEDEDEPDAVGVDRDGRQKLGVSFAGVVTGWSDGEDSNYDADLFFANLDSSESDSILNAPAGMSSMDADGEDGDPDQDSGDEIAEAMTLAAAAGLYEGWEGPIVFAMRDVDVEMNLSPSPGPSRRRRMSSSIITTDDEEVSRQSINSAAADGGDHFEDETEIELAESDGETTEDELIGPDGRPNKLAMMLFKWPVSVGAIDPMSTLTQGRRRNGPAHRHFTPQHEQEDLDGKSADRINTPDGKTTSTLRTPRGPSAGAFQLTSQSVERAKTAIITGLQPALPSPYPRSRRLFSNGEEAGHGVCVQSLRLYCQTLTNATGDSESFAICFRPVICANGSFERSQSVYGHGYVYHRVDGVR